MTRKIAVVASIFILLISAAPAQAQDQESELRKLIKQSDVLFEQRKFDEFFDVSKKAMALIEKVPNQKPAEVAEVLNNLAIGSQRQKDILSNPKSDRLRQFLSGNLK